MRLKRDYENGRIEVGSSCEEEEEKEDKDI